MAAVPGTKLKCFKRRRAQELTEANCTARKLLPKKFFQFAAEFTFFTDEKLFTVASAVKELWKSVKISPAPQIQYVSWHCARYKCSYYYYYKRRFSVYSVIFTKVGFLISQGSAATYWRCGGQCYMTCVANFIASLAVTEFWRHVKFWPSYRWLNLASFLDTVYYCTDSCRVWVNIASLFEVLVWCCRN